MATNAQPVTTKDEPKADIDNITFKAYYKITPKLIFVSCILFTIYNVLFGKCFFFLSLFIRYNVIVPIASGGGGVIIRLDLCLNCDWWNQEMRSKGVQNNGS